MAVPIKPSIRQTRQSRQVRLEREYYIEPSSSTGLSRYCIRLIWAFTKIGLFVLGIIAVMALLGALLFQLIRVTMPISLIALAVIGLVIWLIVKKS